MKIDQVVYKCDRATVIPASMEKGIVVHTDWNRPMVVRRIATFFGQQWRALAGEGSDLDGWHATWEEAIAAGRIDANSNFTRSIDRLDQLTKDLSKVHLNPNK